MYGILALGGLYWKYESEIKKMLNRYVISVLVIIFVISIVFFSDYFLYTQSEDERLFLYL